MKFFLFIVLSLLAYNLHAQHLRQRPIMIQDFETGKYLTFNPCSIFEPQAHIGVGFGNRFSERSEYFVELSYVAQTPFYDYKAQNISGVRMIAQYRYHFLQQWRPIINSGRLSRERKAKRQPFVGIEFRFKNFNFSGTNSFYNQQFADTLARYPYMANATVLGGAIVFGSSYRLTRNGKWHLETSAGIGGRQKLVRYKNLAEGYKILPQRRAFAFGVPQIDEVIGIPYIPIAFKIKYLLN